jgi:hypothetical protein
MSKAKITTNHDAIRRWAEKRGGRPAAVIGTSTGDEAGILRLDFEPKDEEGLEVIDWEGFFEKFDQANLAFLYQEKTAGGSLSRFHKFVDSAGATLGATTGRSGSAAKKVVRKKASSTKTKKRTASSSRKKLSTKKSPSRSGSLRQSAASKSASQPRRPKKLGTKAGRSTTTTKSRATAKSSAKRVAPKRGRTSPPPRRRPPSRSR